LVARAVSNWHRRQVSREEKAAWINGLAALYKKQGLAVSTIADHLATVTGLSISTIRRYLDDQYKDISNARLGERPERRIPASERIAHNLGQEYVMRHEVEVKQELAEEAMLSPKFLLD
jgi:hypothetical protein